jgi:hypothetical protein
MLEFLSKGNQILSIIDYDNYFEKETTDTDNNNPLSLQEYNNNNLVNADFCLDGIMAATMLTTPAKENDDDNTIIDDSMGIPTAATGDEDIQDAKIASSEEESEDEGTQKIVNDFCYPYCTNILSTDDCSYGRPNQRLHGKCCKTCKSIMTPAHIKKVGNINYCQLIQKGNKAGVCQNIQCGVCEYPTEEGENTGRRLRRSVITKIVAV